MTRTCRPLASTLLCAILCAHVSCDLDTATQACLSGWRCPVGAQCTADGTACITDACGNGELDPGEVCDDGNLREDDECNSTCSVSRRCGNGINDLGEVCDDGNNQSGDGCSADCRSGESCGDNYLNPGEACDDGNLVSGDGCSPDCRLESCGDGQRDPGEACDDGNNQSGDGCSVDCLSLEECGNNYKDLGEECDTGGESSVCDANCTAPVCGDGYLNAPAGEACDDGNTVAGDGCSANCQVESPVLG